MREIIGGEFEIDSKLISFNKIFQLENNEYLYASGRSALHYILMNINVNYPNINIIYLPNYLCPSIIEVVQREKLKYDFYSIEKNLLPNVNTLCKLLNKNTCLLLINYFGLINIESIINEIKKQKPEICIILDNVQALFEMRKETRANYSFTSLRKWLPVPDGAIVKTPSKKMSLPDEKNMFCKWKFAAGLLKSYRNFSEINDMFYLDFFTKGEKLLEENYEYECSVISLSILVNIQFNDIMSKRKENYKYLLDEIKKLDNCFPILDNDLSHNEMVPMFLPIISDSRDKIKAILANKNIFCPIHWPIPCSAPHTICDTDKLSKNSHIYDKELSLVIDHRYSINDMQRIADAIKS